MSTKTAKCLWWIDSCINFIVVNKQNIYKQIGVSKFMKSKDTLDRVIGLLLEDPECRKRILEHPVFIQAYAEQLALALVNEGEILITQPSQIVELFNARPEILPVIREAYIQELKVRHCSPTQFAKDYGMSRQGLYLQLKKLCIDPSRI